MNIHTIFVPQGAEYKAVCKGLSRVTTRIPQVVAIPVGSQSLIKYLKIWYDSGNLGNEQTNILVMGLCGALKPDYQVGDMVLYESCVYQGKVYKCDIDLTNHLESHLKKKVSRVKALTSDTIVYSKTEKLRLGKSYGASVVDMEGFAALDFFNSLGVKVSMLRVVSDGCQHDLPNLNSALSPEGQLLTLPLALGMLRQPIAASRLISGSLRGLKVLENVTTDLFQNHTS